MTIPTVSELKNKASGSGFYMPFKTLMMWACSIFLIMLFLGLLVSYFLINNREKNLYNDIQNRMEIITQNKSELVQAWATNLQNTGSHIANADVIRLFASESNMVLTENRKELSNSIHKQASYFQVTMDEYVRQNKLANAYIVGKQNEVFLKSSSAAGLTSTYRKYVEHVLETGKTFIAPFTIEDGEIVTIIARPIFSFDTINIKPRAIATLVSSFVVTDHVLHFLKDGPLNEPGEQTFILQDNFGVMQYIALSNSVPTLYSINGNKIESILVDKRSSDEFDYGRSMISNNDLFATTSYVYDTPFVVMQEYDKKSALLPLKQYSMGIHSTMLLIIVVISAFVLLMLNYVVNSRNKNRVNHQQQVLNALVKSVEIRDPYLSGHHARVAKISLDIANQMRLSIPERSTLYYSAMLSGIGKIFVPRNILTKPGKLTNAETLKLREHINFAMEVLGDMEFEFPIAEVIEQMYERIDGSGYPNSKQGAEINFLSRILGAADVYCALTKPRAYRDAMPVEKALEIMAEEQDKFDKGVVGVLKTIKEA